MKTRPEDELDFDFSDAESVEWLDHPGRKSPMGMKLADYVVEEKGRILIIEVKDPSCSRAQPQDQKRFARQMQNEELIGDELTPKARDSYTYLHLMERDSKPIIFVFIVGIESLPFDPALMSPFKEKLLGRIRQEADKPWKRLYVKDCIVTSIENWKSIFPQYLVTRTQPS